MSVTETITPSIDPEDLAATAEVADHAPTVAPELLDRAATDAPTLRPPGEDIGVEADEAVSAAQWITTKVTALYGHGPGQITYAALDGHGWRRIGGSGGAKVSLTTMLSMAEQTGASCRILVENKVIKTAYVF